ncbi:MAG TPA: glutamine-hydrolyzing GMP synthase [archaeon]|nr:glutamine-hydrolyzing GMP synthase [archaeon]
MEADRIIVLDFGSQYTHLLARRIRELGVYSQIMSPTVSSAELAKSKGIILSGGPKSVYDKDAVAYNPQIFSLGVPILGLCYGEQLIGHTLGGKVELGKVKEYGSAKFQATKTELFAAVLPNSTVWMSHGDKVLVLPEGFSKIGSTKDCEFAAIADERRKIYGLQFHPEVAHSQEGMKILSNFVFRICGCKPNWTMKGYLEKKITEVQKNAGNKNVFLLLSGGVDSTVCLALIAKALGAQRVHALHVDTGFMRKGESKLVVEELEKLGCGKIHLVEAQDKFLQKLDWVTDPEEKRNIIGKLFVDIAIEELNNISFEPGTWLIGQGTIYPDTIETGGNENSNKIKTHHNRAPIIMEMIEKGMVIEPLKDLYKDEVRELGKLLGLPEKLVNRHPFPGPGLAIRILCSGTKDVNLEAEKEIMKIAKKEGYAATILPIKAVGVQGDNRTYRNALLLEGKFDYEALERVSTKITNSFNSINRVVALVFPKKINSIELKAAFLTKSRIQKLQEADFAATQILAKTKQYDSIWQFPVVLLPIDFNKNGEGVVLRPVESKEAMTAKFSKINKSALKKMATRILKIGGIGAVMLDITHKPPATIEWE